MLYYASPSAFSSPASGTMAVAYIQFHWKLQFDGNFFPAINHGELGLVYSFCFLYVATIGDGRWSVGASRARGDSS